MAPTEELWISVNGSSQGWADLVTEPNVQLLVTGEYHQFWE